jgi:branched-subunit amino acid ABC-type transport system permease component
VNAAQTLLDATALGAVYALIAVGIGLVFGVLRLVNFAYGQLIMAGAYALALTNTLHPAVSILICFAVVLGLTLTLELVAFRPLRGTSPATMLVATFAISFLLQNIAVLKFGSLGTIAGTLTGLNDPVTIGRLHVRWITLVAIGVGGASLAALALLVNRTDIGLQMRAAAADLSTARLLGVKANVVTGAAVLLSGVLAATVSVILVVQTQLVTPDIGLRETIYVLVGVVVGGIDRLGSATLGGFVIGFATGALSGFLPSEGAIPFTSSVYLDSAIFALVVLVLLVKPSGLFAGGWSLRAGGSREWRLRPSLRVRLPRVDLTKPRLNDVVQLAGPVLTIVAVAVVAGFVSRARAIEFESALIDVAIVAALYVFVGNSGVLSFGQISFVAVGAFGAAVMSIPGDVKPGVLPTLFPLLRNHSIGNVESLVLAAVLGGINALLVGLPLMRLSGLAAGIATFAVLGITHNILRNWTKIGPGPQTLSAIPETTDIQQAAAAAVAVVAIAFLYQRTRFGRQLRATREDPDAAAAAGIDMRRQRLWAFTLSGALSGFAGGVLVHFLGGISTEEVYLDLTFLSLAMLVVGGVSSLWGAVLGALLVSALDSFLANAENGAVGLHVPTGTRLVVLGAFMALVLVFRPSGITGGREFRLPLRAHAGRRSRTLERVD